MHAIPEKLSALRESFEATLARQMSDYRIEFERRLKDACQNAEDSAVKRSEELMSPQQQAAEVRLGGDIKAGHDKTDEAHARIRDLSDQHVGLRAEFTPLHARADAAAARLDRLGVQMATTTKECGDMGVELRGAIAELRQGLGDEGQRRVDMDASWQAQLTEASAKAASETRLAAQRAEEQTKQVEQLVKQVEQRLIHRMDEQAAQSLRESQLGDQETTSRVMPEIQVAANLARSKAEETQHKAEELVRSAMAQLREEIDATQKKVTFSYERHVDQKVTEVHGRLDRGLEVAHARADGAKSGADAALQESSSSLRKLITDLRAHVGTESDGLKAMIAGVETRANQVAEDVGRKSLEASTKRLEDAVADLGSKLNSAREESANEDYELKRSLEAQLADAVGTLERHIQEASGQCSGTADAALRTACAQLRHELADTAKTASARVDEAHKASTESLSAEAQARQAGLASVNASREALGTALREEIRRAVTDAAEHAQGLATALDKRLDTAKDVSASLERSLEALQKELADSTTATRAQLRSERQRTEEADAENQRLMVRNHDSVESHLQSEAADIRQALAECRRRLNEEVDSLRRDLREQPTKRDVAETAVAANERCNALTAALDGHRTRLEATVADFASRTREMNNEVNEARLRMQRENLALGKEITQLRAAATSLTNGVVKGLQVIGLVRDIGMPTRVDASPRDFGAPGPAPVGEHPQRTVEVEELLEWEKAGKSLSTRISRQWYQREVEGYPTVLSVVDAKANTGQFSPGATAASVDFGATGKTMGTASTSCPSPARPATSREPLAPSYAPSGHVPEGLAKVRQQRVAAPGSGGVGGLLS